MMNKKVEEMKEIRKGLLQGLDRSIATIDGDSFPKFSVRSTMFQIRKGLEKGLDLSSGHISSL